MEAGLAEAMRGAQNEHRQQKNRQDRDQNLFHSKHKGNRPPLKS
jgi:hypothetical protein